MIENPVSPQLIEFLRTVPFLQSLPEECILNLASQCEATRIQSGEVLLQQGEVGDCLYVVQSGRLIVIKQMDGGAEEVIADIGRGELIGELALFTQATRAATVIAIRDSVLWKLSKEAFEAFIQQYPIHIMPMVRAAILRLSHPKKRTAGVPTVLTLVPAGRCSLHQAFVKLLIAEVNRSGSTLHLTIDAMQKQFPEIDLNAEQSSLVHDKISKWLSEQELFYRYVIYEVEPTNSSWTKLCLRQADKILLLGNSQDSPELGEIETTLFASARKVRTPVQLAILHERDTLLPVHTSLWLKARPGVEIFNIRHDHTDDIKRLVRLSTREGIALVLGGGGAKGLAHLGVYKALTELGVPIDRVGGTSMGSLIGALIAMDIPFDTIIEKFKQYIIHNKKFNDYTIPFVSLLGGYGWLEALKNTFGEAVNIDDLWKNFFCIASNFTLRRMEILEHGLLYKALRASTSLPGVVPPISNEADELLVDGGIFNNLPVDVMRRIASPCQIIAVRVSPFSNVHAAIPEGTLSGFKRYMGRFNNRNTLQLGTVPGLAEMIMGAVTLCNDENEMQLLADANYAIDINLNEFGLLEFSKFSQVIDIGYRETMEKFSKDPSILSKH